MTTPAPPNIWCRQCFYELRGLTSRRCPECGTFFDPKLPSTFSPRSGPPALGERIRGLVPSPEFPAQHREAILRQEFARLTGEHRESLFREAVLRRMLVEQTSLTEAEINARVNALCEEQFKRAESVDPEVIAEWLGHVVDDLGDTYGAAMSEDEVSEILNPPGSGTIEIINDAEDADGADRDDGTDRAAESRGARADQSAP